MLFFRVTQRKFKNVSFGIMIAPEMNSHIDSQNLKRTADLGGTNLGRNIKLK
jgi:hypothetical protein